MKKIVQLALAIAAFSLVAFLTSCEKDEPKVDPRGRTDYL